MADELPPPKRDVNEVFTLDASDPTSDLDGPLAHLMSESPVADPDRASVEPAVDDNGAAPEHAAPDRDLPDIADVSGLEDLYMTTAELPLGAPLEKPSPTPLPSSSTGAAEPETIDPSPEPVDIGDVVEPARSVWEVQNLRFSTEAGHRFELPPDGRRQAPPPVPAPAPAPPPVSPGRSVRVPGQDRRRAAVLTAFEEITERRWFWGMMTAVVGMAVLGLMAAGDLLPTLSATDPADVVADDRLPAAPAVVEETETSAVDTSSSSGAGTFGLDPSGPTTSVASSTTVPAITARRRVTTAQATVRSTTTQAPTTTGTVPSTTTSVASSTTAASSTTPSTPTTASTTSTSSTASSTPTTDPGDTTTTTTGDSSTTMSEDTTTTHDSGGQ